MILARGFGMRVVGGKTGMIDGRLFAHIVWTVGYSFIFLIKIDF